MRVDRPEAPEHKKIIEGELEEVVELLNRGAAAGTSGEFLLVAELLRRFRGGPHVLFEHNSRIASAVSGASNVVERHLARKTKSTEEYNYLLLGVAKQLLEVASTDIESKYHTWQRSTSSVSNPQ